MILRITYIMSSYKVGRMDVADLFPICECVDQFHCLFAIDIMGENKNRDVVVRCCMFPCSIFDVFGVDSFNKQKYNI